MVERHRWTTELGVEGDTFERSALVPRLQSHHKEDNSKEFRIDHASVPLPGDMMSRSSLCPADVSVLSLSPRAHLIRISIAPLSANPSCRSPCLTIADDLH